MTTQEMQLRLEPTRPVVVDWIERVARRGNLQLQERLQAEQVEEGWSWSLSPQPPRELTPPQPQQLQERVQVEQVEEGWSWSLSPQQARELTPPQPQLQQRLEQAPRVEEG